jgi:hypothetical protein
VGAGDGHQHDLIVALQQAKQSLAETVTGSADGAILSMKPEELLELLEVPEP